MKSEQINELAKAICAAQGELTNPHKNCVNPFYKSKYADLASIIATAKPILSKHGLSFVQCLEDLSVETILMHESGQWISSSCELTPTKNDPQGAGSAITYARRYSLAAILGMSADDDDDANGASTPQNSQKQAQAQSSQPSKPNGAPKMISAAQAKRMFAIAKGKGWTLEQIKETLQSMGINSSKEIPENGYDVIIDVFEKTPPQKDK